jgi:hypothetical protein
MSLATNPPLAALTAPFVKGANGEGFEEFSNKL